MQTISVTKRQVNEKDLFKKTALPEDTELEYADPAVFTHDGKPIVFYGDCTFDLTDARRACETLEYQPGKRTSGLITNSRTFGALPRDAVRKDFTALSALAYQQPAHNEALFKVAEHFDALYRELAPETYAAHKVRTEQILKDWVIKDTVFTSGIANNSNQLKYHYDRGNFKDTMSCMLTFRKNIDGGYLSIPQFNMKLKLRDSTFLLFDGQSVLHGVTPIRHTSVDSYRYTVVYYSLEKLLKSKTADEELAECRRRATEKYNRRAGFTK